MFNLDIDVLSKDERLNLIEALWDSLDEDPVELTAAQTRELDDRAAASNASPGEGRDAFDVLKDLRHRLS